ncbi:PqqD family protein [Arthrobacter silviterrae]
MANVNEANQVWTINSDIAHIEQDSLNRVAILNLKINQPVILSRTAAELWHLIISGSTRHELVKFIFEKYEISSNEANIHVKKFIDSLIMAKIILSRSTSNQGIPANHG